MRNTPQQRQCAGEEGYLVEGATQVPIVQSIPFGYDDLDEWMGVALGEREGHIYSRNTSTEASGAEEGEGAGSSRLGIGQVLVDQPDRHSALAHRGGDPLDRTAAHVARREYPRQARLQQVRLPREFLPSASLEH